MGYFLLILLFLFVVFPLVNIIWKIYTYPRRYRRSVRDAFEKAARQQQEQQRQQEERERRNRKKIDPEVGEYVAFEEVKTSTRTTATTESDGSTTIRTESQIEDAVWEDIK